MITAEEVRNLNKNDMNWDKINLEESERITKNILDEIEFFSKHYNTLDYFKFYWYNLAKDIFMWNRSHKTNVLIAVKQNLEKLGFKVIFNESICYVTDFYVEWN